MWLFTQRGFISAVQSSEDNDKILVRARDKKALEFISELYDLEVLRTPSNDYPYRVIATREQFTNFLATEAEMLDYSNYKSRLEVTRGNEYYYAASHVWHTMHEVEDADARSIGAE
jgi:hypothetical protein